MKKERFESLDALRGLAILGMVLSGSIAFGDLLPPWMFHAQVPPPNHKFDPSVPGITWVDLVFPFFLFSMGAAIPLALNRRIQQGASFLQISWHIIRRFILLAWLAYFFQHSKPILFSQVLPEWFRWAGGFIGFGLLAVIYMEFKSVKNKMVQGAIQVTGLLASFAWVYWLPYQDETPFRLSRVDIIILVLANVSLFGSFIWWATRKYPLLRLWVLVPLMGILLSKDYVGTWQHWLLNASPLKELYNFLFLKYLFLIIPGTWVGEAMLAKEDKEGTTSSSKLWIPALISLILVILNLWGLFTRHTSWNMLLSILLCFGLLYWIRQAGKVGSMFRLCIHAGTGLLIAGLSFESFEGGIKKDSSTFSYYLVTGGLAFFTLLFLFAIEKWNRKNIAFAMLVQTGQNPLVAYTAGALVVLPLLALTGLKPYWDGMNSNVLIGLLKGMVFTGLVLCITLFFTRRKWFWKS
jgi:predicted acyltransferase